MLRCRRLAARISRTKILAAYARGEHIDAETRDRIATGED